MDLSAVKFIRQTSKGDLQANFLLSFLKNIIGTDEDPNLRVESSAIINLRGVSRKHKCMQFSFNNIMIRCPVTFTANKSIKTKFLRQNTWKFYLKIAYIYFRDVQSLVTTLPFLI